MSLLNLPLWISLGSDGWSHFKNDKSFGIYTLKRSGHDPNTEACFLVGSIINLSLFFLQVEYWKGYKYRLVSRANGWFLFDGTEEIMRSKWSISTKKKISIPTHGWEYSISTGETLRQC